MKVLNILSIAVLLAGCFSSASAVELVAYYSFDSSEALTADSSGNGNHLQAEISEMPGYTAQGAVGGAAVFNGTDQGLDIAWANSDPQIYPDGSFTAVAWVKPAADIGSRLYAITRPSGNGGGFIIHISSGTYRFGVYPTGTSVNSGITATNEWAHLALVFEAETDKGDGTYSGTMSCYVNGASVGSSSITTYDPYVFRFGLGQRAGGSDYFDGAIDEFAIFDGTLTGNQIYGLASLNATVLNVFGYSVVLPIAYYSFNDPNEPNHGLAFDDSGNGSHLQTGYTQMPDYTNDGVFGGAAVFNGTDQGFDLSGQDSNPPIYPDGSFTATMWLKTTSVGGGFTSITRPSSNGGGFAVGISNGTYRFNIYSENVSINSGVNATNDWVHLALVFEAETDNGNGTYAGTMFGYVNGVSVGSSPVNTYNPDVFRFGLANRAGGSEHFNGIIDDFAIWDTALNPAQIAGLGSGEFTPMNLPFVSMIAGDLNNDGIVNLKDFAILAGNWLKISY